MFRGFFFSMLFVLFGDALKSQVPLSLPRIDTVLPRAVGMEGGVLDVHGQGLFPTTTSIWVGEQPCPLIRANSDPHGRFLACSLPPSKTEIVAKVFVRVMDRSVPCVDCNVEYRHNLLAQAHVTGSHLRGAPGDAIHLLPSNDWDLVEHHLQVTATIGGLSTTPDEYDAVFRQQSEENSYSDQLHVTIPIGLEAGDYPLHLTIGRAGPVHPSSHGHVRFTSNSTPIVHVVPTVTDIIHHIASDGAVTVSIYGAGFSPSPSHNSVLLAGHKCIISQSDYHFIFCALSPIAPKEDWRPSRHPADRGFPLDITPLKQDNCAQHVSIDEPSITIPKAVTCMTHTEPTQRVVLSSEFVFPVPHPLHVKSFELSLSQFHAVGEAYLHPPIAGYYTFLVDCVDLRFKHLCQLSLENKVTGKLWKAWEQQQEEEKQMYMLGPVFLDGERSQYVLKTEFLHLAHGEQLRLSVKIQPTDGRNGDIMFEVIPAEWFSFIHPLSREVHVEVNGLDAACRPKRPAVGCQFDIAAIPTHAAAKKAMLKATETALLSTQRKARVVRRLSSVRRKLAAVTLAGDGRWSALRGQASTSTQLTIPLGSTVILDADMDVSSLTVEGTLTWDTTKSGLTLSAGYVLVHESGKFQIGTDTDPMVLAANIYIKNNGEEHSELGDRFFGGYIDPARKELTSSRPVIEIYGRPMSRTWSLLKVDGKEGDTTIQLDHNVAEMGWSIGHRIAIAATYRGSDEGEPENFKIVEINGESITLDGPLTYTHLGQADKSFQAEVVNLDRNILIHGDEVIKYKGLHTLMSTGGHMVVTYTRIQDCGQRGVLGKYCLHFHLLQECSDCLFKGNAIENSFQRGIVVHGTHKSMIEMNILYMIRGANLYVEDGNELQNTFSQNVAICPDDGSERATCRIAGTDNEQADYGQQSGLWALSVTNNFIENRFVHTYNGFFTQTSAFILGRGMTKHKVCPKYAPFGVLRGNVNHGCGRFGFYLDKNWPRQLDRNFASDGMVSDYGVCRDEWCSCNEFKEDGSDNGHPGKIEDGLDFFNNLVGQYQLGDMQWLRFKSINNNHGMYWKATKNFADGCSPHLLDCTFQTHQGYDGEHGVGLFLGPGGIGTFIIENTVFAGRANCAICSNQHCQVSGTGVMCTPEYTLKGVTFNIIGSTKRIQFAATSDSYGVPAIFTSFDDSLGVGIKSVVHGSQKHIIDWSKNKCQIATDADLYDDGITCSVPVRRLQVWSKSQTVKVTMNGVSTSSLRYMDGTDEKQGYGVPVLANTADDTYSYSINVDESRLLAIEYSDITYGNFFGIPDEIELTLNNVGCGIGGKVSSMHNRNWIGAHGVMKEGMGACGPSYSEDTSMNGQCPDIPLNGDVAAPFRWEVAAEWGECSVTCGTGVQTKNALCYDSADRAVVSSYCIAEDGAVVTSQSCVISATCPVQPTSAPVIPTSGLCTMSGMTEGKYADKIMVCSDEKKKCEVYQSINGNLSPSTCTSFCEEFDLACVNAWSDVTNKDCTHKAQIGCDDEDGGTSDHICQCGLVSEAPTVDINQCALNRECVEGIVSSITWLLSPANTRIPIPEDGSPCEWAYGLAIKDNGLTGVHGTCPQTTTLTSYTDNIEFTRCYGDLHSYVMTAFLESNPPISEDKCTPFWTSVPCSADFTCGLGWQLRSPLPTEECGSTMCTRTECCYEEQTGVVYPDEKVIAIARFGKNTDTVTGYVEFTQEKPGTPATVTFNLKGLAKNADVYHVHTGKVNPSQLTTYKDKDIIDCSYEVVGGHLNPDGVTPGQLQYEKGDLATKFGSLIGQDEMSLTYQDIPIYLDVRDIIGRSFVLHDGDGVSWVCANIVEFIPIRDNSMAAVLNLSFWTIIVTVFTVVISLS